MGLREVVREIAVTQRRYFSRHPIEAVGFAYSRAVLSRARCVIETGIASGVSTAFISAALVDAWLGFLRRIGHGAHLVNVNGLGAVRKS